MWLRGSTGREPMMFLIGMHQPEAMRVLPAAFISVHRLRILKEGHRGATRWIMDSGAFTTIAAHGGYPEEPEVYAAEIRRWANNPGLLAAVSQDYMCESVMLARTGLTIADHQRLTIERYDAIKASGTAGVYLMPVLQGYPLADYVGHIRQQTASRLKRRAWVGVGSVCKTQCRSSRRRGSSACHQARASGPEIVRFRAEDHCTRLWSGAQAPIFGGFDGVVIRRSENKGGMVNSWREARSLGRRVQTMPVQHSLLERPHELKPYSRPQSRSRVPKSRKLEHGFSHWVDHFFDRVILEPGWWTAIRSQRAGRSVATRKSKCVGARRKRRWGIKPSHLDWYAVQFDAVAPHRPTAIVWMRVEGREQ